MVEFNESNKEVPAIITAIAIVKVKSEAENIIFEREKMAISSEIFIHELDRAALSALKAIPGFTPLLKGYMKVWSEKLMRIEKMARNVRINERQMAEYYEMLPGICDKLGIDVPELYMELDPYPNAYTFGDTTPIIVMTSGLIETVPKELIPTILAHECGHIVCHHVLYSTMGQMILNGAINALGLGQFATIPIKIAFAYWMRCSEYSADRAAAVCDGNADKIVEMCMRFAGYDKDIPIEPNVEEFMQQAKDYKELVDSSKINKTMEFLMFNSYDHPINALRAYDCNEWTKTDSFKHTVAYVDEERAGVAHEFIPMPIGINHYEGKNYTDNADAFKALGFRSVLTKKITEKGLFTRNGQTVKISINGEEVKFKIGDWIKSDAQLEITYYEAETEEEAQAAHPGQVKLPEASSFFIGKQYEDVVEMLKNLGFTNISVNSRTDFKSNWLSKDKEILNISIDGIDKFAKDTWFKKAAPIEIGYRSMDDTGANRKINALGGIGKEIGGTVKGVFQNATSFGRDTILVPKEYKKIRTNTDDMGLPKEAIVYSNQTDGTQALLVSFAVSEHESMPFDNTESIISELHESLDENSGIIEVNNGITKKGRSYVYDIIKHSMTADGSNLGNAYILNINVKYEKSIQFINASFSECGMTGYRDATGYELFRRFNNGGESGFDGWCSDPYDPSYQKGFLMNMSERYELDDQFPDHPLSHARKLVEYIVENN